MKIRRQPKCAAKDIVDHIKLILKKKPDVIIIHSGINDIKNDKPTKKKIKKMVQLIEEANTDIQIIVPDILMEKTMKFVTKYHPSTAS